ncbi:hypothetical protein J6590_068079 [Homalodisca vitripennis]|nr:hypothetical protein J6590_068079 [Homalodisca vitripennis]
MKEIHQVVPKGNPRTINDVSGIVLRYCPPGNCIVTRAPVILVRLTPTLHTQTDKAVLVRKLSNTQTDRRLALTQDAELGLDYTWLR